MKTVEEWLHMLKEPYRSWALAVVATKEFRNKQVKSVKDAIGHFSKADFSRFNIDWHIVYFDYKDYIQPDYHKYLKPKRGRAKVEVNTQTIENN